MHTRLRDYSSLVLYFLYSSWRLMGMRRKKDPSSSSSAHPCADLRTAYHDCFNRWYSEKFSKGQWDKEECVSEWEKYRACLAQHLEDKKLSRLLLEAEAAVYLSREDPKPADSGSL